jgi:Xaa-Pro aminopeptidase
MRALGIDGFNFRSLVGSGKRTNICVPPASTKQLRSGELVMVAFGPKCKGYTAGASCMYSVDGKPSDDQKRWMAALANALRITRDALRPGVSGKEIDAIPRKYLADLGYAPYCTMPFVHTIGLNEYERPFFGPNSEDKLELNLTVCIDSSMFFHPTCFGGRVETGYVIRDGAAESLSKTLEDEILALA